MNMNLQEGVALAKELNETLTAEKPNCGVVICTPFIHLASIAQFLNQDVIGLGAENCADKEKGAYTGEVSAEMVKSTGAQYVILGHSERRGYYGETPEILKEKVEIRNIAREAGSRSKMAVRATMEGIDPVGACVGPRGGRVGAVVEELGGEKIDIVVWSEDPCEYVRAALSPANVVSVSLIPGQKACRCIVPDDQLSLAIGKEGQNARLAARLTGYKVDIKPASQAEPAEEPAELEELRKI